MPVICRINIKEVVGSVDIAGGVCTDVPMDDMPIWVLTSAHEKITVTANDAALLVRHFAMQKIPVVISVTSADLAPMSKTEVGLLSKIAVSSSGRADNQIISNAEEEIIAVFCKAKEWLEIYGGLSETIIDVNMGRMGPITGTCVSAVAETICVISMSGAEIVVLGALPESTVSVSTAAAASLRSALDATDLSIRVETQPVTAQVGIFTTVEDSAQHTVDSLSATTATNFYFVVL